MNSICNIEYFIEISQISELPSIFNFVTSMMSFKLNIYYISWLLRNYIVLRMNLTFIYQFFILLSLHFRLLSFYWSTTVITEKRSYHLKELSTSLELTSQSQSLITFLLQLALSSISLSSCTFYLHSPNVNKVYTYHNQGITQRKSASGSRTLACRVTFFQNRILIQKCQKCSLNRGTLVPTTAIYQTKGSFTV